MHAFERLKSFLLFLQLPGPIPLSPSFQVRSMTQSCSLLHLFALVVFGNSIAGFVKLLFVSFHGELGDSSLWVGVSDLALCSWRWNEAVEEGRDGRRSDGW